MKKQNTKGPVTITHTEILALALRALEDRVAEWRSKLEGQDNAEELLQQFAREDLAKIESLKILYKIETGVEIH